MDEALPHLYEVKCPFCKRLHRSRFYDEIDEEILACRERAPEAARGTLAGYEDPRLRPICPETAAHADYV